MPSAVQLVNRHTMWIQFADRGFGGVYRDEVLVNVQIYRRINHHYCKLVIAFCTGFAPGHEKAYTKHAVIQLYRNIL